MCSMSASFSMLLMMMLFSLHSVIINTRECDGDIVNFIWKQYIFEINILDDSWTWNRIQFDFYNREGPRPVVTASAVHPNTGAIFVIINYVPDNAANRAPSLLGKLLDSKVAASSLIQLPEVFDDITFDCNGTLYGITSDTEAINDICDGSWINGASPPKTTIEFVMHLDTNPVNKYGETLTYNWDNHLFYRITRNKSIQSIVFQSIDILTMNIDTINISDPNNNMNDHSSTLQYIGNDQFYLDTQSDTVEGDASCWTFYHISDIDTMGAMDNISNTIGDGIRMSVVMHAGTNIVGPMFKTTIIPTMHDINGNIATCIPSNICPTSSTTSSPICDNNNNSASGQEIQCQCDQDCCIGFNCRKKEGQKKGKCGRVKNGGKKSKRYADLLYFDELIDDATDNQWNEIAMTFIIIINLFMVIYCCFIAFCHQRKRQRKIYQNAIVNDADSDNTDSENIHTDIET